MLHMKMRIEASGAVWVASLVVASPLSFARFGAVWVASLLVASPFRESERRVAIRERRLLAAHVHLFGVDLVSGKAMAAHVELFAVPRKAAHLVSGKAAHVELFGAA